MYLKKINIWYLSSFLISVAVAIPIVTVFSSFFDSTSNYSDIIKTTPFYNNKELINKFCDYAEELKFVKEECLVTA